MNHSVVIRNPASGRGLGASRWPRVETLIRREAPRGSTVECLATEYPGHAAALAAKAAEGGAELVIAAGGDGTISEVANGLIGSSAAMAIVPMGTGNDLCRTIGVQSQIEFAAETAFRGQSKQVDVVRWNCGQRSGYFMNVAGCGFDAKVAERVNQGFKRIRGTSAYLAAVLSVLRSYQAARLMLDLDGEQVECDAMLCAFANGKTYGGGMRVAPDALLDDGLLDIVLVESLSKAAFLRAFPSVFRGRHLSHPKVRSFRARRASVRCESPMPALADGESIGLLPADFEVVPGALRLMHPSRPPNRAILNP